MSGIFRNRPTLVEEVRTLLLDRIKDGVYDQLAGRLPSEIDLAKEYGVSRATIRDVLRSLEFQGLIRRRRGVGTFIDKEAVKAAMHIQPFENTDFLQLINKQTGNKARYDVHRSGLTQANEKAPKLKVDPDEECLSTVKIFCSGTQPVIHCWNLVPLSLVLDNYRKEVKDEYAFEESVYTFLRVKCNRVVDYHDSRIQAKACPKEVAKLIDYESGSPILQLEEVGFSKMREPLFYGLSYMRSDVISFSFRRGLRLDLSTHNSK